VLDLWLETEDWGDKLDKLAPVTQNGGRGSVVESLFDHGDAAFVFGGDRDSTSASFDPRSPDVFGVGTDTSDACHNSFPLLLEAKSLRILRQTN